ncbi:hypothetical protein [Streptomyces millisiae]|uniref:Uncharacterized protein n=1 Tax=Streptomyces millisiae TaxID=3075542 RepID=A0ABU2LNL3_9ACTN|nr:hypothetical protein [Streptomyces sp. DSM 44918]MDT0318658.1 hypothetical protein [Streptomyces sp. DSM 44918]
MRATLVSSLALALATAVPATTAAADPRPAAGWEPAPSAPWEMAAGARCDFPVSGTPVVDEVERLVLDTHQDGSPRRVAYRGDLVVRVTNADTGAAHDADASGTAVVTYHADGAQTWRVLGPVLVGFAEHGGNLPRGIYVIDGAYTMEIDPGGFKEVTLAAGTVDDLCARVD